MRMQRAILSAALRSLADVAGEVPLLGRNCLHACCADLNAGDCGLIESGNWNLWPGMGSGKLARPWLRMQRANWSAPSASPGDVLPALAAVSLG